MLNKKGFVSLLGLILTLMIIFFIGYKAFDIYLKPSDKKTGAAVSVPDSGGYYSSRVETFVDTKEKIKDINKMSLEREDQFLNATKEGY